MIRAYPRFLPLVILLAVLLATSPAAATASGNVDPLSRIIAGMNAELKNPLLSPCSSPAWKLVYTNFVSPGERYDSDHCVQFVAVRTADTTLCPDIRRDAPKTKCFAMIAGNTNDPSICNRMPPTSDPQAYLKEDCFWEVAIKNNNPAACNAMGSRKINRMIIGEMSRQTCLARLGSGQGVGESTL